MKCTLPILALTLCVASCALPHTQTDTAALPFQPAWKIPAGFKLAQPSDQALPEAWWTVYGDADLNALMAQVSKGNQTLAQADAQYRQAVGLLASAQSTLYPGLTATLGATRSQQPILTSGGALASPPASNLFQLSGAFSWEPDLWGALHANIASSEATARAGLDNRGAILLSLQAQLASSYFQLRAADAILQLLRDTVAADQRNLDLTNARHAGGLAARTDVTQASSQLESARASLADAAISRDTLEHALAVLTGHAAQEFRIPARPWAPPKWPALPIALPSTLLERRPDIANAERLVAAQAYKLQATESAFYPVVTLNATIGFESKQANKWLALPKSFWSVGPQLTQYLLDGGNHTALRDQTLATLDQATAAYREVVLESFQSVQDAMSSVAALDEEIQRAQAAAEAAAETLALVTEQYKSGTVGYLNVLSAQTTLLSAQLTVLNVNSRQGVAHVNLVKALGGGWKDSPQTGG